MSVFIVTPTPNLVSGPYSRPYLVRNAGTAVVYLGQDSSLAVGAHAISMPGGSTLNWSGDTQLWAMTAAGESSTLEILYTGDSAFTPGPTNVNATIVPVVDNLFYQSVDPAAFSYQSPWVDVLDYQTMVVEVSALVAGGSVYNGESDIRVTVEWSTTASVVTSYESEVFGAAGSGFTNYRFPVVARFVRFTITRKNPVIQLQVINFKVNGLNYVLPSRYMCVPERSSYDLSQFGALNQPAYADDYIRSGSLNLTGTMAATRNAFAPIPHVAGPVNFGWGRIVQVGAGSGTMQFGILDGTQISFAFRGATIAAGALEFLGVTTFLPKWPVALQVQTSGAATLSSFILNLNYQGLSNL